MLWWNQKWHVELKEHFQANLLNSRLRLSVTTDARWVTDI